MVSVQTRKDLCALLSAALWRRGERGVSVCPDWKEIYGLASRQGVAALAWDGAAVLNLQERVPEEWGERFAGVMARIVAANVKANERVNNVCRCLEENDVKYVLLKGQGVGRSYPLPWLRMPGDIDILVERGELVRAKELIGEMDVAVDLNDRVCAEVNDNAVRWFDVLTENRFETRRRAGGMDDAPFVPSATFDAWYLLIHTARHLGSFGVTLRQVVDWVVHVTARREDIDWKEMERGVKLMHLEKLYNLFTAFGREFLGAEMMNAGKTEGTERLWRTIERCQGLSRVSCYGDRRFENRVSERLFRSCVLMKQALRVLPMDREFGRFLLRKELRKFFVSIFNF